jgi:Flp pilus assembly protein TadG
MKKLLMKSMKRLDGRDRGQVLVLVALAIVGIVAAIGLSLDVGVMFIDNARLRRAVDAAALAAALQFREGYTQDNLDRSAKEFLVLNGIHDPTARVDTCGTDASLCTTPQRKLVRVIAHATAQLGFLPVIGIDYAPIAAEAISETASVEVVLVIDRSESMTYAWDTGALDGLGRQMRDPSVCNAVTSPEGNTGYCQPFNDVKQAAISFVQRLYFPFDHVAIVSFATTPTVNMPFSDINSNNEAAIISTIRGLTVFQGEETMADPTGANAIYPSGNPSRWYDHPGGTYFGLSCPQAVISTAPGYPDPSPCTTTNIGGGLLDAGNEFVGTNQRSLWVVILLTDGVANAGYGPNPSPPPAVSYYCPMSTWPNAAPAGYVFPKCNDAISTTRHGPSSAANYDAEDYAYDMADYVGEAAPAGQGALLFTIGLGDQVTNPSIIDGTALGQQFLDYVDPTRANYGLYFQAPSSAQLQEIFRKIAENIATRLTH